MDINSKQFVAKRFQPKFKDLVSTGYIWNPKFLEEHFKEHKEHYSHLTDGWIRPFREAKVVPFDIVDAKILNTFSIMGILYISNIIDRKPVYSVALFKKPVELINSRKISMYITCY